MEFTEKVVESIKDINSAIKSEVSIEELSLLLKQKSELTGINHSLLLRLASDKDNLFDEIYLETQKIDAETEKLEKQLNSLRSQKHILGSLICELHGHDCDWEGFKDNYCIYCGQTFRPKNTNAFLRKQNERKSGLYKK